MAVPSAAFARGFVAALCFEAARGFEAALCFVAGFPAFPGASRAPLLEALSPLLAALLLADAVLGFRPALPRSDLFALPALPSLSLPEDLASPRAEPRFDLGSTLPR